MKKTKIFYWIGTVLFSAAMLFSAIPDILIVPKAKIFMNNCANEKTSKNSLTCRYYGEGFRVRTPGNPV